MIAEEKESFFKEHYVLNRLYSSVFQHERKKGQSLHLPASFLSIRYCFPGISVTLFSIISIIHGGIPDLQPCLLSQFMQYRAFGFINAP